VEIRDLQGFPPGHPPSPWPLPVVGPSGDRYAVLASDLSLRAVGWLGATVPTTGVTPPECIDRLVEALDSAKVIAEGMRGYHECEVCEAVGSFFPGTDEFSRRHFRGFDGKPLAPEVARLSARSMPAIRWREKEYLVRAIGHHLIQLGRVVYMCPQFTLHYILHHEYRPPEEFIQATIHGRFLSFDDLSILPVGGQKEWFDRLRRRGHE
jgi:hypothetical protein